MSASAADIEIGLSEASFLWLAAADQNAVRSVYDAVRRALDSLHATDWTPRHAYGRTLVWAQADAQRTPHDVALWHSGGNLVYLVEIKQSVETNRARTEAQLKLISDASAEPPRHSSFRLASLESSTDFVKLVEALTDLTTVRRDPHLSHFEPRQPFTRGIYELLPEAFQLDALAKAMRLSADHVWGVSEARGSMKSILDRSEHKPQLLRRGRETYFLVHSGSFSQLGERPSAAEDAEFFFSRRAPVEVPRLSRGRQRAAPLVE